MSEVIKKSIHIDAAPEDVYAVAADLASYPEWTDGVESVEILEDVDGIPVRSEMVINAQVKTARYILQYEHTVPERMAWVTEEGGDIRHLEGEYVLTAEDGGTRVDYRLELDLGFPIPGFMMRKLTGHIAGTALTGLKVRVEGG